MIPIEDKDPIEKLGIQKGSDNYKAIQAMLDKAREDEALKFSKWIAQQEYRTGNDANYCKLDFNTGSLVYYTTEQLYSLFKSKI